MSNEMSEGEDREWQEIDEENARDLAEVEDEGARTMRRDMFALITIVARAFDRQAALLDMPRSPRAAWHAALHLLDLTADTGFVVVPAMAEKCREDIARQTVEIVGGRLMRKILGEARRKRKSKRGLVVKVALLSKTKKAKRRVAK